MFHAECRGVVMTYLRTKFHRPSSNYSVLMATTPKAKYRICTLANYLFQTVQKEHLNGMLRTQIFMKIRPLFSEVDGRNKHTK